MGFMPFTHLKLFIGSLLRTWLENNSPWLIALLYGDFWNYRKKIDSAKMSPKLYTAYLERHNSYIGIGADIASSPIFPHGLSGIFISNNARIGRDVVIFQHVTIGSNSLKGHTREGSPVIGDNVYIGAGAKIIGKVTIGKNCRIGANCVVVKDMPPNTTAVLPSPRFITRETINDNGFISVVPNLK